MTNHTFDLIKRYNEMGSLAKNIRSLYGELPESIPADHDIRIQYKRTLEALSFLRRQTEFLIGSVEEYLDEKL